MNAKYSGLSQNKVECKWRYLVSQYNDIIQNKKTTGGKRKTFRLFDRMDKILGKRHDINPPVASGSGCVSKAFTLSRKRPAKKSQQSESIETVEDESDNANVQDSDEHDEEQLESSVTLSGSKSAVARRNKRKKVSESSGILDFLKQMEANRKEESLQREKSREKRSKERNDLLREFLTSMKRNEHVHLDFHTFNSD